MNFQNILWIGTRDQDQLSEFIDFLVWTLRYILIQNKYPEEIDLRGMAGYWDLDEISSITPLNDKVVIDVGAGAGNITFTLVNHARTVFAVEPVTSLREFICKKNKTKWNYESICNGWLLTRDSLT
jgi:hypothetical protein